MSEPVSPQNKPYAVEVEAGETYVVEVKINLIVMALTKEQIFSPLHLLQKKPTRFIYAAVKKPVTNRSVMAATISRT